MASINGNSGSQLLAELQAARQRIADLEEQLQATRSGSHNPYACLKPFPEKGFQGREALWQFALEGLGDGVWDWDLQTNRVFFSKGYTAMIGYGQDELGSDVAEWESRIHPDDLERVLAAHRRHMNADTDIMEVEYRLRCKDGSYKWILGRGRVVERSVEGEPLRMVGTHADITDRKAMEERLQASTKFLDAVFESIKDGISILDPHLTIRQVNATMRQWYASSLPLEGKKCYQVFQGRLEPCPQCPTLRCLETGQTERLIVPGSPESSVQWIELFSYPVKNKTNDGIDCVVEFVRDITEQKRVEEALRKSEELFRSTFHTHPEAININRLHDGLYIDINRGFSHLMGYTRDEVLGKTSLELNIWRNADDRRTLLKGLQADGAVDNLEAEFLRKDGSVGTGLMSARLLELNGEELILSVTRDITERKRAETEKQKLQDQLLQAQKMESVGRLAGGVAHDLNNMLVAMLGYGDMILADPALGEKNRERLSLMQQAALRSRDLVRQLLAFSRKQTLSVESLDANSIISEFQKLLHKTLREDIRIHLRLASALPAIQADRSQLEQVILNLAVNAQDAMPQGGTITFETGRAVLTQDDMAMEQDLRPGTYIYVAVSDTGLGMDPKVLEHIFEPFYTTKQHGEGTGLGLSTVYGVVKQHQGGIQVSSEPGLGTTFTVLLPEAQTELRDEQPDDQNRSVDMHGRETVLVVEDNEMVRELTVQVLEGQGYTVFQAASGHQCLELIQSLPASPEMMLTDVIMPDINGKALYEQVARWYPEIRVVYMSGYTDNIIGHHGILDGRAAFLQKPFSIEELCRKVREILDRSP